MMRAQPMNDLLSESIKLAHDAAREAFKAGHDAGYRLGFKEGVAEAQKIVEKHFGKPADLAEKTP